VLLKKDADFLRPGGFLEGIMHLLCPSSLSEEDFGLRERRGKERVE